MDNKKDSIIQAALKRFAHYGFNKTTMSEIAVDLNITKANLYYYYPDKNALIKDVLISISENILRSQYEIIEGYDANLVDILIQLLEKRASFLRDYYVLHISENLEWIKGQGVGTVLEEMHLKDIEMMTVLFQKAEASGEIALNNAQKDATCYIDVIKGLSLIRSVADILSGMPNAYNIDEILASQKCTTNFIFKNKLISKN